MLVLQVLRKNEAMEALWRNEAMEMHERLFGRLPHVAHIGFITSMMLSATLTTLTVKNGIWYHVRLIQRSKIFTYIQKKWLYSENRCKCNIIYNLERLALNLDHSRLNGFDSTLKNTHMQKKIRNLLWKMHILLTFLLYLLLFWGFF